MLCILKMLLVASVNEITGEYFDNISRVCIKCINDKLQQGVEGAF